MSEMRNRTSPDDPQPLNKDKFQRFEDLVSRKLNDK